MKFFFAKRMFLNYKRKNKKKNIVVDIPNLLRPLRTLVIQQFVFIFKNNNKTKPPFR